MLRIAQNLCFNHGQLYALLIILRNGLVQELPRFIQLTQFVGQVSHAYARGKVILPILYFTVVLHCLFIMLLRFTQLAKVVIHYVFIFLSISEGLLQLFLTTIQLTHV